jgi:hypothetical protein
MLPRRSQHYLFNLGLRFQPAARGKKPACGPVQPAAVTRPVLRPGSAVASLKACGGHGTARARLGRPGSGSPRPPASAAPPRARADTPSARGREV